MTDFEERVRLRAYMIWEEEGCPEERGKAHWEMARELVLNEERPKQAPLQRKSSGFGTPAGGERPVEAERSDNRPSRVGSHLAFSRTIAFAGRR
jgi:hypothetical protein